MPKPLDPAKRELILQAAISLFVEKGYTATTTAAIAKRAGMSSAHMYIYFASKDDLLMEAIRRMMAEHTALVAGLAGQRDGLDEAAIADLIFGALATIRPRILFIMQCYLVPQLTPLFGEINMDYSGAFLPYFRGLPPDQAGVCARGMMALADSYFLIGDFDRIKQAAVWIFKNARNAQRGGKQDEA